MTLVLIISPEPWAGHFVSKHHYALELVHRGHRVLFHGPPEIGALRLESVEAGGPGRLEVLRGPRVAPGLRLMPAGIRRSLEARWLDRTEKLADGRVDVVWLFENSRFFDMGFAGDRLKIYQQVDLNQDFHPETAAASADLAIAISGPIENRIARFSKGLLRITHGCPRPGPQVATPPFIDEAFSRHRVNAVMTGNLSIPYLDDALLAELAAAHTQTGFHFIGGYTPGHGLHERLSVRPNVVFWGWQPACALSAFLERADVLLVAYRAVEHLDQLANPHKIMEYLAAGRCVLASRTLEYEVRPDLVVTASDVEDYCNRFAEIISDPGAWNTPDLIARRRDFAADNTYSRQLDRIASALGGRGSLIS